MSPEIPSDPKDFMESLHPRLRQWLQSMFVAENGQATTKLSRDWLNVTATLDMQRQTGGWERMRPVPTYRKYYQEKYPNRAGAIMHLSDEDAVKKKDNRIFLLFI